MSCRTCLLTSLFIFLLGALGCITAGIVGTAWYQGLPNIGAAKLDVGLWRYCIKSAQNLCYNRDDLFKFRNNNEMKDIILILMIAGGGLALITIIFTLSAICSKGKFLNVFTSLFAFLTLGSAGTGMSFFEYFYAYEKSLTLHDRMWCYYVGWVGVLLSLIGWFLSLGALCTKPTERLDNQSYAMKGYPAYTANTQAYQGYPNNVHQNQDYTPDTRY